MTLAVFPPEYFPGLRTSAILVRSDVVVLADTYRYVRQTLQNRAGIRTPDGRQWMTVPVGHGQHGRSVADTRIRDVADWRAKHLKALRFNYGAAPYFEHYIHRIQALFEEETRLLGDLTSASTRVVADLMGCRLQWKRASEMNGAPGDLPSILESAGPGTLLVPESGREWPVPDERVTMRFVFREPAYRQQFVGFVPGCSVLDMLMLHGPATRELLLSSSWIS